MYIFTNTVKRVFLPCLVFGVTAFNVEARQQDSTATRSQDSVKRASVNRIKASGVIKDASTGKGLDGIRISVPGYSAAITNQSGEFSIAVPDYNVSLVISSEGFQTKEIALKGKATVSTVLYEETYTSVFEESELSYSSQLATHNTGASKTLSLYDNWQRANESTDTYLQGRVTGLHVTRRSGTSGIGANLLVRGYNSLYTSNQPLYVVDGIYYDNNNFGTSLIAGHIDNPLSNIDIKDIHKITVIKDATASSYGSKAANGVVLITTSRATQQATQIDFAAYGGYNSRPSNIPVMNSSQYRSYLNDLLATRYNQSFISSLPFMIDDMSNGNYFRYHNNTDWQKQVLNSSYNQNYYLKVTGGDNIATYGLSVGFLNNNGITDNTNLRRYQTRFNADLRFTEKLKGIANLSFISNEQDIRDQGLAFNTNPIYLALTKAPFLSSNVIADNGAVSPNFAEVDIFGKSNPLALVENAVGSNKNYRFMGSLGFGYEFNKNLTLNILGGVNYSKVRENMFIPEKGVVLDTLSQAVARNRSGTNSERLFAIFNDTRLSYSKVFSGIHSLSANTGFRYSDSKMEGDYGLGFNSATDDFVSVGTGLTALRQIGGENGAWRSLNLYANADYGFRSKYFASFNIGVDRSSRFGVDAQKYAVLPSIAAGWLISSEKFMANNDVINILKLRASYGLVGNDEIGNYSARKYYVSQNFLGYQGLVRGNLANTGLKWETVAKANLGVDVAMFNERLNISLDLFSNKTSDMLIQYPVATLSGFESVLTNDGSMNSKGAELGVNTRILNKSVKWDFGLNISTYRNEVTAVPDDRILSNYAGATILTQEGMASNLFYGYRTNGVYASSIEASNSGLTLRTNDGGVLPVQAGDTRFIDIDGNKIIDENDREVIGNPNPDFTGMFSNNLRWKRFGMDAIFTFSKGNDVFNFMRYNLESMNGFQNQLPSVGNRWRAEGQVTDVPRAVLGDPTGNSRFSDRWIENGSYLRLRTVSFSYDVPMKRRALKYTKIYLTGNNLFTLTKYLGYDPEFSAGQNAFVQGVDTGREPQFKSFQFGVRVGL